MLVKFTKDQKWIIDKKVVSFKKDTEKDINNIDIANEMISNKYAINIDPEFKEEEIKEDTKEEKKEEEEDTNNKEIKEEKVIDDYEKKVIETKDKKKGRPKNK